VGVDGVHVAPLVQQQLRDVRTPAEGGPMEGDVMFDVSEGRVGALVDEEVGDVGVAVFARPHQRRPSAVILTVDEALGGGGFQQRLARLQVAALRRQMEGGHAVRPLKIVTIICRHRCRSYNLQIDAGTGFDQVPDDVVVRRHDGRHQGRVLVFVEGVRLRPRHQQHVNHRDQAPLGGVVQDGAVVALGDLAVNVDTLRSCKRSSKNTRWLLCKTHLK
jgi:hypothetical protein